MKKDDCELRTPRKIKVGEIVVVDEELAVYVKNRRQSDVMTMDEIIQGILGKGIKYHIEIEGDLRGRIARVKAQRPILILSDR